MNLERSSSSTLLPTAGAEHLLEGGLLGARHRELPVVFDADPLPGVDTPVRLPRRLPRLGPLVPLGLVEAVVHGEQVAGYVGEALPLCSAPRRRAAPPGVGERDYVVYINVLRVGVDLATVRVEPLSRDDIAELLDALPPAVADQGRIAGVAALGVRRPARQPPAELLRVRPVRELLPGVPRHRARRADPELRELAPCRLGRGRILCCGRHSAAPGTSE